MAEYNGDQQHELSFGSDFLPTLRVAVNRRPEHRVFAPMNLRSDGSAERSTLLSSTVGLSTMAPDAQTPGIFSSPTMPEGNPLRPLPTLPTPWRDGKVIQASSKSIKSTQTSSQLDPPRSLDLQSHYEVQGSAHDISRYAYDDKTPALRTDIVHAVPGAKELDNISIISGRQSPLIPIIGSNNVSGGPRHVSITAGLSKNPESSASELTGVRQLEDGQDNDNQEHPELGKPAIALAKAKRKRGPRLGSPGPKATKYNHRPGRRYEMQWRVGQAPTARLKDTIEATNHDRVLGAVSRYYEGNADGTWRMALHNKASEYDGNGFVEAVAVSIIMATGLIAAGQAGNATQVLNKTLPLAEAMLLGQHPQICFYVVEISADTSQTVAGNVRRAIRARFAPLACRLLGEKHPLSVVLRTPLTTDQQVRMRRDGQVVAHDSHVRTFGTYSYQTMIHQWYWGRVEAASGNFGEAIRLSQGLTQTWEQLYSTPNSAVAVSALVEQARILIASGEASVRVECLLGDALRRIDVLSSAQSMERPILDAAELRLQESGPVFSRLAALRALGRLHVMRHNWSTALVHFEQAMVIAEAELTEQSSVRRLCQTDLAVTKMMDLERAMGVLTVEDPTSRLPPISSIVPFIPIES